MSHITKLNFIFAKRITFSQLNRNKRKYRGYFLSKRVSTSSIVECISETRSEDNCNQL